MNDVDRAVAERFRLILSRLKEREGDHIYTGYRTNPEELGWRFRQMYRWLEYEELAGEIRDGRHDARIEATWHDAAGAQHYYEKEKDWGSDEPEINEGEDDSEGENDEDREL